MSFYYAHSIPYVSLTHSSHSIGKYITSSNVGILNNPILKRHQNVYFGLNLRFFPSTLFYNVTRSNNFYEIDNSEDKNDFFFQINDDSTDDSKQELNKIKKLQNYRSKSNSSVETRTSKKMAAGIYSPAERDLINLDLDDSNEKDIPLTDSSTTFSNSKTSYIPSTKRNKETIFNNSKPLVYRSDKSEQRSYRSLASDLTISILKLEKGMKVNSVLNKHRSELDSSDIAQIFKLIGQRKEWKRAIEIFHWMKNHQSFLLNEEVYSALVQVLTWSGMTITASSILAEMHELNMYPPVHVYFDLMKTMIKIDNNGLKKSLNLFFFMKRQNIRPNKELFEFLILSSLQSNYEKYKKASTVLFGLMKTDGYVPSENLYIQIILYLCTLKYPNFALTILNEMEENGYNSKLFLYNSIMASYNRCALPQNALSLKQMMDSKGIKCSLTTYNNLLGSIKNRRINGENIKPIFEEMIQRDIPMDMTTYSMLIIIFGSNKEWSNLEKVLKLCTKSKLRNRKEIIFCLLMIYSENNFYFEMEREIQRLKKSIPTFSLETYNRLLFLYGNGDGNLNEIVRLFIELENLKYVPTPETFIALIKAFGIRKHFDMVKMLLSIARSFGYEPHHFDNSLLLIFAMAARIDDVCIIKNAIKSRMDCSLGLGHWNTIILGLKDGPLPHMQQMFEEMKQDSILPNKKTYEIVINAHTHRGRMYSAFQIYKSVHVRVDVTLYESILNGCWWGAYADDAQHVISNMQELNMHPSPSCYASLLACYSSVGMWKEAEETFQKMKRNEEGEGEGERGGKCQIDERICSLLLNAYIESNCQEEAKTFLSFCESRGYTSLVQSARIKLHGQNAELDEMLKIYVQVLEEDATSSSSPHVPIMQVCLNNNRIDEILEITNQVSQKYLNNDVEMLTVLMRVIQHMVSHHNEAQLHRVFDSIKDLNYPACVQSLLIRKSSENGVKEEGEGEGEGEDVMDEEVLNDVMAYDDDLMKVGVYDEVRREFFNTFVDTLWILGRRYYATRLFQCAVERNMYSDLCYTTGHEACIHLRQVFTCGARIVIYTWLAAIQEILLNENVQNSNILHQNVGHFVIILTLDCDSKPNKEVWEAVREVCEELNAPFASIDGKRMLATREEVCEWLLRPNLIERFGEEIQRGDIKQELHFSSRI